MVLKIIRTEPNSTSSAQGFEGLKLLTRMRLDLSHLAEQKFRHNFRLLKLYLLLWSRDRNNKAFPSLLSQLLLCKTLHCLNYRFIRQTFFEKNNLIKSNILQQNDWSITEDLHFDNEEVKDDKSNPLLTSIIEFIQRTGRFKSRWFNRFNWHLLYKAFNRNLLPVIKRTDYCITPSTFHLHIYFCYCDDH